MSEGGAHLHARRPQRRQRKTCDKLQTGKGLLNPTSEAPNALRVARSIGPSVQTKTNARTCRKCASVGG